MGESVKYKQKKMEHDIKVETKPNGYVLTIDSGEFMYRSVHGLIKGLITHLGVGCEEALTLEGIDNLVRALKDGSILKKLRQENSQLKREVKRLRKMI